MLLSQCPLGRQQHAAVPLQTVVTVHSAAKHHEARGGGTGSHSRDKSEA